ncbi:hypothetical protein F5Y05DRAFT_45564 [Hypoxylon sp. FL0543]|nr:hypothetical protein F5Y05DRAFT_45564 [Hypoxylon sp. FL0543]
MTIRGTMNYYISCRLNPYYLSLNPCNNINIWDRIIHINKLKMHLSWLPPFTFLAGFVAVSLAASGQPLGEWTVSNASRKRSQINTLCTWHFTVTDNTSGGHTNNVFDCDFNVTAQPGADCGLTSFQDYCSGNEAFTVNGGHSELGFVVVVLADTVQKSQAFFGFGDDALDSGSEIVQQTKPVYAQTTVKRDDISVPRDGGSAVVANATEWIVEDLFRGK